MQDAPSSPQGKSERHADKELGIQEMPSQLLCCLAACILIGKRPKPYFIADVIWGRTGVSANTAPTPPLTAELCPGRGRWQFGTR